MATMDVTTPLNTCDNAIAYWTNEITEREQALRKAEGTLATAKFVLDNARNNLRRWVRSKEILEAAGQAAGEGAI